MTGLPVLQAGAASNSSTFPGRTPGIRGSPGRPLAWVVGLTHAVFTCVIYSRLSIVENWVKI